MGAVGTSKTETVLLPGNVHSSERSREKATNQKTHVFPSPDRFKELRWQLGLPRWLNGKESACSAGDVGLTPGSGRSPRERNGNLLQYSCLERSTDRGAWLATVIGLQRVRYDFATHGLPFPSPGDLPNPGIDSRSPASQADSLSPEPPGKPSTAATR